MKRLLLILVMAMVIIAAPAKKRKNIIPPPGTTITKVGYGKTIVFITYYEWGRYYAVYNRKGRYQDGWHVFYIDQPQKREQKD